MKLLTWQENGAGTINCVDGHIHLRHFKDLNAFEQEFAEVTNECAALPPPSALISSLLTQRGYEYKLVEGSTYLYAFNPKPVEDPVEDEADETKANEDESKPDPKASTKAPGKGKGAAKA